MNRVGVWPELLRWARERSRRSASYLRKRFPQLDAWERGSALPTFRQLEAFAKATYATIGYLFLQEPPVKHVPVTDFRTIGDVQVSRPSPDLLDTLHLCQQRQDWYRDEARTSGDPPLADVSFAGRHLRAALGFDVEQRRGLGTWSEALRQFIEQAEVLGILVMVSGIVGSNTPSEARPGGVPRLRPVGPAGTLVFINGADTKAAQMFDAFLS